MYKLLSLILLSYAAQAKPPKIFPIVFHLSQESGASVVEEAWLDAEIKHANALFKPHGVQFERSSLTLSKGPSVLKDRRDRNRLGRLLLPSVINCFVVATLMDIHTPGVERMGVHWRVSQNRTRHMVIIAAHSRATVLAHELGHFFGNHKHSKTPGNIMSYQREGYLPFFDKHQGRVIRAHARRFLRTGELKQISHKAAPKPAQRREPP